VALSEDVTRGQRGADAADPVVAVRAVTKRFVGKGQTVHALGPIDLAIRPGEFVSLLGPSGCGKSTLLNVVAGLLPCTTGDVLLKGRRVLETPPEIGMMFQSPVLLDWRTTRANVLLPIEIAEGRRAARAATDRADELLERVGLGEFVSRFPSELSGGMQQRVAICRMLIAGPEVLLLDEPFGALDEITREAMNVELRRIFEDEEKTALFVTHNIQEAVFLSDRVVVMTGRPGTVAGIIDVDLPKPRRIDIVTSADFQEFVRRARELLNLGAGVLHRRSGP
jgi:NitT/TauT family transport system ATP-binding protein